jgi:hypothetical protein
MKWPLTRAFECGAYGTRTPDLFHAMEARYQLRQSPSMFLRPRAVVIGRRGDHEILARLRESQEIASSPS